MTWTVLKYNVDDLKREPSNEADPVKEAHEDPLLEDRAKEIEEYVKNYTDNYLISLHYLNFPVVFMYTKKAVPLNQKYIKLEDCLEPYKEINKIINSGKYEIIRGFSFLQKQIAIKKEILDSKDQETFDMLAMKSGLEPYVINDLRTLWKNRRFEYLRSALVKQIDTLYKPNEEHPLYMAFVKYLEKIYKRGIDRFKTFICVGSTFIGKSVFFTKFLVPEQYYIYHSNFLEYSKMADQPKKIFRILDDIHWEQVSSTELKALMNRNISSVNIKYGYEYIFPLIPIIIMNGEDYKTFKSHFSDIWEFIERNAVIYPPQHRGNEEETVNLFTKEISVNIEDDYIFNNIMDIKELEKFDGKNMNEWIRNELVKTCGWKYNTTRYIQLPENEQEIKIPNFELDKKTILKEYEEYLLRKKQKEMENEKKPKAVGESRWSEIYERSKKYIPYKRDSLEIMDEKKEDKYDDDDETEMSEEEEEDMKDDVDSDDSSFSEDSEDNEGFIEL